jgi:hypothetical protein
MSSPNAYVNCTVHKYYRNLVGIEHPTSSGVHHKNLVIFVGGLGDGITTVPYVRDLSGELDKYGWGVVEILTLSSFDGWGCGSLPRDAYDITQAVRYFRSKAGGARDKIVVQGHSTGTQDTMYYLTQQYPGDTNELGKRPAIDGAILQANASDREAYIVMNGEKDWADKLKIAQEYVAAGKGEEALPNEWGKAFFFTRAINARRWVSLMAVRGGDDYFSSDLNSDDFAKTFGKVQTKLLVAYSGNDEFVPSRVDKQALVKKWEQATDSQYWSRFSGVVEGATHNVNDKSAPDARSILIAKIVAFLTEEVA